MFHAGDKVEVFVMGRDEWVPGNYRGPAQNGLEPGYVVVYDGGRQGWFRPENVRKVQDHA